MDCVTWAPLTLGFQLDLASGSQSRKLAGGRRERSGTIPLLCHTSSCPGSPTQFPPIGPFGQGKKQEFPTVTDPWVTHLLIPLILPTDLCVSCWDPG